MNFEQICDLIIAICGVIPTIISIVLLLRNIIKTKHWDLVMQIANEAMSAVEAYAKQHPEMTSEDKLNMALEAIKAGCGAVGIKVNEELIRKIIDYITKMCAWSKTINCGK